MIEDDSSRGRTLHSRTRARGPRIAALATTLLGGALVLAGCASARATPKAAAAPPPKPQSEEERLLRAEIDEQHAAQRTWCTYLQALYLRASAGETAWPRFGQCAAATTMASPEMLRRTADCSMRALERFVGDPFTPEYASQVGHCGNEAIESLAASENDVAPYVAAICGRANVCGGVDPGECRERLGEGLAPHLERALGAINRRGRARLRTCFRTAACQDLGSQISSCLEPIMDDLLWLPG